jgi:hypothetical protein
MLCFLVVLALYSPNTFNAQAAAVILVKVLPDVTPRTMETVAINVTNQTTFSLIQLMGEVKLTQRWQRTGFGLNHLDEFLVPSWNPCPKAQTQSLFIY